MEDRIKLMLSQLGAFILAIPMYIVFHELGHTLVAIACRAQITDFSIITAHMSYNGGNFNQITDPLLHVAGMLLPVLINFIFILTFNSSKKNMFYCCFSVVYSFITVSSVFAWIIVPVISIFSKPPTGDDVANFMTSSQWNPFVIIIGAVFLITIQVIFALYKGLFKAFFVLIKGNQTQKMRGYKNV